MVKKLRIRESGYNTSWKGRRVKESRYSDVVPYENRKYWYFTTHGIGPGTIPKGVHILDVKEGQNKKGTWGDYICLDAILNTSELREFDLIELVPDNVNEGLMFGHTYEEVMKKIENRDEIETNFWSSDAFLPNYNNTKKFPVYIIYAEYRDVAEDIGSRNYQWVLAGYTDNGVLYLTADEIDDYNLHPYMNGEVITNLEGMVKAFPEEFYIDDVITE